MISLFLFDTHLSYSTRTLTHKMRIETAYYIYIYFLFFITIIPWVKIIIEIMKGMF